MIAWSVSGVEGVVGGGGGGGVEGLLTDDRMQGQQRVPGSRQTPRVLSPGGFCAPLPIGSLRPRGNATRPGEGAATCI